MRDRLFTPRTARQALAEVRRSAEAMALAYRCMKILQTGLVSGDRPVDREYFELARTVWRSMDRLRSAGIVIQDPAAGLLGFPARRAGRAVLLCWKVGEPSLAWWHEAGAGPSRRQPLDEDGPWDAGSDEAAT